MEVAVMRVVNDHHVGLVYHPLDLMNRFKVGEQLLNPHPLQTKICIHIGDVGICQHHGIQTVERTIGVVLTRTSHHHCIRKLLHPFRDISCNHVWWQILKGASKAGVSLGDVIEELVEWNWIDDVIAVVLVMEGSMNNDSFQKSQMKAVITLESVSLCPQSLLLIIGSLLEKRVMRITQRFSINKTDLNSSLNRTRERRLAHMNANDIISNYHSATNMKHNTLEYYS